MEEERKKEKKIPKFYRVGGALLFVCFVVVSFCLFFVEAVQKWQLYTGRLELSWEPLSARCLLLHLYRAWLAHLSPDHGLFELFEQLDERLPLEAHRLANNPPNKQAPGV